MTVSRLTTFLLAVLLTAPLAWAQPLNDEFSASFPITTATSYTGTTTGVSPDAADPAASCSTSANSVWWYFRSTAAGTVTIDLSGSTFDTVLAVRDTNGAELGCDDDSGTGSTSRLVLTVPASGIFFIRVTGFGNSAGDIAMSVSGSPITGPAGDLIFSDILPIPFNQTIQESNVGATSETGEPPATCGGTSIASSIWRDFTATATGPLVVRTDGSTFDTVVDIFRLDSASRLELITCQDDAADGTNNSSRAQWDAVAGTRYFVRVRGFGGASGSIQMLLFMPATTAGEDGPEGFALAAPFPNPAAGLVRLGATLAEAGTVHVEAFDALGRSVAVVADETLAAGEASWTWDAAGQPAGVYMIRIAAAGHVRTQTVTVVR